MERIKIIINFKFADTSVFQSMFFLALLFFVFLFFFIFAVKRIRDRTKKNKVK